NQNIVYSNAYGQAMLSLFKDTSTSQQWLSFSQYDSEGRVILEAAPSAVTGYDEGHADLLNSQAANYQYLADNTGLLTTYSYYSTTTATQTTAGGVADYLQAVSLRHGEAGMAVPQESLQYFTRTVNGATVSPVATDTVYRNDDGTGAQTTSYAYT